MSIIGEILHGNFADDLADAMISAAEDSQFGDCRSCVKGFAKQILYPLYLAHKEDSYDMTETEKDLRVQKYYGHNTEKIDQESG